MSVADRAAEVIGVNFAVFYDPDRTGGSPTDIAQALADAGLLLSDADRAVLDAADEQERVANEPGPYTDKWAARYDQATNKTEAAVRARRETQPMSVVERAAEAREAQR